MTLFMVSLLTASRSVNVTLYIAAIPNRKSPDFTVCTRPPAAGPEALAVAAGVDAPAGTVNVSPGRIKLFVVRSLALSKAGRATPTLAAIPARKSPGLDDVLGRRGTG